MKIKLIHTAVILLIFAGLTNFAKAQIISPILETPPNLEDNVSLTPVFSWDNLKGAAFYEILVYKNNENEIVINFFTAENSYYDAFTILEPGTTYHWKVRAFSYYNGFDWSDVWEFNTISRGNNKPTEENQLPKNYSLHQNYPNPFNPVTKIRYELPKESYVKLSIFDITGKEVDVLADGILSAGYHDVFWNAANTGSGVYFYRLESGSYKETKKMIVVK